MKTRQAKGDGEKGKPSGVALSPAAVFALLAVLTFVVSSWLSFSQQPHPDPFSARSLLSWEGFRYPVERNAFKRLPHIRTSLTDLFLLPETEKLWAVSRDGLILHSPDGGLSWQQQWPAPESVDRVEKPALSVPAANPKAKSPKPPRDDDRLKAIFFVDARKGWAVGSVGTILTTADGGSTWTAQTSGTNRDLSAIQFLSDGARGWVVGARGTILTTADGGGTWTAQTSGIKKDLAALQFLSDGLRGWAVGAGSRILTTADGGRNWNEQKSDAFANLAAVQFLSDGQRGWAVGWDGTILTTADGGGTWTAQNSGMKEDLWALQFQSNGQHGWVVGVNGTILTTADGGGTWTAQNSGTKEALLALQFQSNGQRGWVVGLNGTIRMTADGGGTWTAQNIGTKEDLLALQFQSNGQHGWVVGGGGTILTTADGGGTWTAPDSGTKEDLLALQFQSDGQRGWAVGGGGTILTTADGGGTWTAQNSGTKEDFWALQFRSNGQHGWAVGWDGTILTTADGGGTWTAQNSGTKEDLWALQFRSNGQHGWVVGGGGTILTTADGGGTWTAQNSGTKEDLWALQLRSDGQRGWVVGGGGTILTTADGGGTWTAQNSGTKEHLLALQFQSDGQRGWAVGTSGTILTTADGGGTWTAQNSGTKADLLALQFQSDGQRGWAMGLGGTILTTADGGNTWKDRVYYARYPAPWLYLVWLLAAGLLWLALRAGRPQPQARDSVVDKLVSDRPLEAGDPDPLGFNGIALGLSRFLRNENTQPPLTLAITGAWGSGKSSLMNLLRSDLHRFGFRTIWFNAWHHQKEENLLAPLLKNILAQAVPSWWTRTGLEFRWRLLQRRGWRHWMPILLVLGVFFLSAGYVINDRGSVVERFEHLTTQLGQFDFWARSSLDEAGQGEDTHHQADVGAQTVAAGTATETKRAATFTELSVTTLVLSTLTILGSLIKGFGALGIDPAKLMASMSGSFKVRDFSDQLIFRHRYAKEFADVANALMPRTMVLFVDDLDRCQPDKVLEMLEAINYLVASGPCFVVIGMDPVRVVRCVGLEFKDLAAESMGEAGIDPSNANQEQEERQWRAVFARRYLEKLINIEVPVPEPDADQTRALLTVPAAATEGGLPPWWQMLLDVGRKLLPVAIVAGVALGGWQLGEWLVPKPVSVVAQALPKQPQRPAPATSQPASVSTPADAQEEKDPPAGKGFVPGQTDEAPLALLILPVLLLLASFAWWLLRPREVVVRDSPEFQQALTLWHDLVADKSRSPRSLKRFMNRVRYFAMGLGNPKGEAAPRYVPTRFSHWLPMFRARPGTVVTWTKEISEAQVVALAAIHHAVPERLETDLSAEQASALPKTLVETLLERHGKTFGHWPPKPEQIAFFRRLSEGIYVH